VIEGDKQLLYRGARLKNTKWIYGLVIYTGRNTKIIMNSDSSSVKMSQVEVKVNYILGLILLLQIFLCIILGILYGSFRYINEVNHNYIDWNQETVIVDSILIFFSYVVLINTMIPISLIVSM
jgi:magnesium-transporting ATPase (P-type)